MGSESPREKHHHEEHEDHEGEAAKCAIPRYDCRATWGSPDMQSDALLYAIPSAPASQREYASAVASLGVLCVLCENTLEARTAELPKRNRGE